MPETCKHKSILDIVGKAVSYARIIPGYKLTISIFKSDKPVWTDYSGRIRLPNI